MRRIPIKVQRALPGAAKIEEDFGIFSEWFIGSFGDCLQLKVVSLL